MVLSNLASEEELNNEQDATDIMEDTKEKCDKDFGGVDAALLITPGKQIKNKKVTCGRGWC